MLLLPPRSTLFPYTTLFRSLVGSSRFSLSNTPTLNANFTLPIPPNGFGDVLLLLSFDESLALANPARSEEHTSELQSQSNLVCRLLLEKKKKIYIIIYNTRL